VVVFRRRIVFPLEEVSVVFGFFIIFSVSLLLQQRFEFHTNIEKDLGFKVPLNNVTINVWTMTTGFVPQRVFAQVLSAQGKRFRVQGSSTQCLHY